MIRILTRPNLLASLFIATLLLPLAFQATVLPKAQGEDITIWEGTYTTPQGETFRVKKVVRDGENLTLFTDESGKAYTKEELYDKIASEAPRIDPALSEKMSATTDMSEPVPVVVFLKDQPQEAVFREKEEYAQMIDAEASKIRAVYERILAEYGPPPKDRDALAPLAEFESTHITAEERKMMDDARLAIENLLGEMRRVGVSQAYGTTQTAQAATVDFVRSVGGTVKAQYATLNAFSASIPLGHVQQLADRPEVAQVYMDRIISTNLDNGAPTIWADAFWFQSPSITGYPWDIGIVDSGVDKTHPSLSGHAFYETTFADSNQDGISDEPPDDLQGHGTHVAGIVSSTNPPYGYTGVAYGGDAVINAKAGWLGGDGRAYMYWSDAMEAIEWAIFSAPDDADSINLSYGGSPGSGDTPMARFLDSVVDGEYAPIAVSAGNDGPSGTTVSEPGVAYNIMSVAASDDKNDWDPFTDTLASFSSRGPTGDGRRKPDITAPGYDIMSTNAFWEGANPDFVSMSGTSMAAPHIAGAYLLLLPYGIWRPMEMKARLINSALKMTGASATWDAGWGWGYTDLYVAKYNTASFTDSLGGDGDFDFYVGSVGQYNRASVVWNRHATYQGPHYPWNYYALSDIDLHLYDWSGTWRAGSATVADNVEQVNSPFSGQAILKVYAWDLTPRPYVGEYEEYALATPPGFVKAQPPTLQVSPTIPVSVTKGTQFWVYEDVYNSGGIPAHSVQVQLSLPASLTLISGSNPQTLGSINPGNTATASWVVRADQTGLQWIDALASSVCYGQGFYGFASSGVTVQPKASTLENIGSQIINGATDSVIFVYPDTTTTGKPPGMYAALYTDWTAIGIPIGLTSNRQYESRDTSTGSPLYVNSATGRPGTSNMVIVTVGGTLVHSVVHWLEVEPSGSISPAYYGGVSGGNHVFIRRSDSAIVASQPTGAPASYDTFVIYTVGDGAGNVYYVFYGLRWRGSMASTHKLLEWVQQGQLSSQTFGYEVWRWDDTNGDGMANPAPVDTYTLLASG